MTGLYWLATSEQERQRARELARSLQQTESRDELGIGSVRDALADLLLPGTSTLHTRARYHLFVPWAFQQALARGGKRSVSSRVRDAEGDLIAGLKASAAANPAADINGLIGRDAGRQVKRMPSALYWQGLYVWGVRRVGGTQNAVERMLASGAPAIVRDDDGAALDATRRDIWHPNLPAAPPDHPADADFRLTFEEAEFLAERLAFEPRTRGTALAQLAELEADHRAVEMLWLHPNKGELSGEVQHAIEQGRRFSLLMYGAGWIYNVVLAHMRGSDLEDEHRDEFAMWADAVTDAGETLAWDLSELWAVTGDRVPWRTRLFVRDWQKLVVGDDPLTLVDDVAARALVIDRERRMKGPNARTVNAKALAQWGGRSGTAPLDFRWSTARTLIGDIRSGLALG